MENPHFSWISVQLMSEMIYETVVCARERVASELLSIQCEAVIKLLRQHTKTHAEIAHVFPLTVPPDRYLTSVQRPHIRRPALKDVGLHIGVSAYDAEAADYRSICAKKQPKLCEHQTRPTVDPCYR
jgi:hypothetical protein